MAAPCTWTIAAAAIKHFEVKQPRNCPLRHHGNNGTRLLKGVHIAYVYGAHSGLSKVVDLGVGQLLIFRNGSSRGLIFTLKSERYQTK